MERSGETESLFAATLHQDLATASFAELGDWCRSLGLSDRGTREELERRILDYHGVSPPPRPEEEASAYEVTIESASRAEYFTMEAVGETYVRLTGGVVLEIKDFKNDAVHRIRADTIIFNRTRNIFSAGGEVEYRVTGENRDDRFAGKTLVFNIETLEAHFFGGSTFERRTVEGEEMEFRFSGDFITRTAQDLVLMDDADITSSIADPPNYRISARRIWILGGGEWGLQDGTLYVGRIPVLYFPFFFYPGDEVVFHPVFGYGVREGTFVQTTTYLLGNKPARQESVSALQLGGENSEERVQEKRGLFLHDTNLPIERPGQFIKAMVDLYSRLGAFAGIEGNLADVGVLKTLKWNAGLGLSRTLYSESSGFYTPYFKNEDGSLSTHWDRSDLLGTSVPFRYAASLDATITGDVYNLHFLAEIYADPYFPRDFLNRKEDQDWVRFLTGADPASASAAPAIKDSLSLQFDGGWTPDTGGAKPWVEQAGINRFLIGMRFRSKDVDRRLLEPFELTSPSRRFYYPDSLRAPELDLTLAGTLLTSEARAPASTPPNRKDPGLAPPWPAVEDPPDREAPASGDGFLKPDYPLAVDTSAATAPVGYSIGYRISPKLHLEYKTASSGWTAPDDIEYEFASQTLTSQNTGQLMYEHRILDKLLLTRGTLSTSFNYRSFSPFGDRLTDSEIESAEVEAWRLNTAAVANALMISTFPLQRSPIWSASNLSYTFNTSLFKRTYAGVEDGRPVYDDLYYRFTQDMVTAHETKAYFRADFPYLVPSLSLGYVHPPLVESWSANAGLITGPLTSTAQARASKLEGRWVFRPFVLTEQLVLGDFLDAKTVWNYDVEEDRTSSWTNSLRLWFLTSSLTMRYGETYEFEIPGGWIPTGRFEFVPRELSIGVKSAYESDSFWKNRVYFSLGVFSDFAVDLERFTEASLILGVNLTLHVHRFLDLSFESLSRNSLVYRYFPGLADSIGRPWVNPIEDIFKSLNFFDSKGREESLFKLASLAVKAVHHLDDWDLTLEYSGRPELVTLNTGLKEFRWNWLFTIFLRWKPIPEIESEFRIDNEGLSY